MRQREIERIEKRMYVWVCEYNTLLVDVDGHPIWPEECDGYIDGRCGSAYDSKCDAVKFRLVRDETP